MGVQSSMIFGGQESQNGTYIANVDADIHKSGVIRVHEVNKALEVGVS